MKFAQQGEVQIDVTLVRSDMGIATLLFTVTDTGIGLAPDVQRHMFAPFSQADASTTRRFGGTGLGLSICRPLTELMGGQIFVTSELNHGSSFGCEFQFEAPRQIEARESLCKEPR